MHPLFIICVCVCVCARTHAHACVGYTFMVCIWRAEDNTVESYPLPVGSRLNSGHQVLETNTFTHTEHSLVLGSQGLELWLWHSTCLAYTMHRPWVWPLVHPPPPQTQNLFISMLGYLGEGLGFKNHSTNKSQAWWQKPFILALGRLRQGNLFFFWGQLGLHKEFQDLRSYVERPYLKKKVQISNKASIQSFRQHAKRLLKCTLK